jgi:hypothetical protein
MQYTIRQADQNPKTVTITDSTSKGKLLSIKIKFINEISIKPKMIRISKKWTW